MADRIAKAEELSSNQAKAVLSLAKLRSIARQTSEAFSEMVKADENIDFYAVFRKEGDSDSPNQLYTYLGKTKVKSFIDFDVQSGVQYWYALVAVDKAGNMSCPGFPKAGKSQAIGLSASGQGTETDIPFEITPGSNIFLINGKIYHFDNKIPIIPGYNIERPDSNFVQIQHKKITTPDASDVREKVFNNETQTFTFKETKGAFVWAEKSISEPTEVKQKLPVIVKANIRYASRGYRVQLHYRKPGQETWQVAPMQRGAFDQYSVEDVRDVGKAQRNEIKVLKLNSYVGGELLINPIHFEIEEKIKFVCDVLKPTDPRYVNQIQVFAHLMYDTMYRVKTGDTWLVISQKFDVREPELRSYNHGISLEEGKYVKIPSSAEGEEYYQVEMDYDQNESKTLNHFVFAADKSRWKELGDLIGENEIKIKTVITVNFGGSKNQYTSDMYNTIKE